MIMIPSAPFLKIFKSTSGALSVTESISIMNIAVFAPEGNYLEMGSYNGKSAMSALTVLKGNGYFQLLEPDFVSIQFANKAKEPIDKVQKMVKSKVVVFYGAEYSTAFLEKTTDKYSFVFSDAGNHQDGLPMQEVLLLEDRIVQGGIIAFHDFGNQFREPKEAAEYLVRTGKYQWVEIKWEEIINYVKENNLEEGNNSWHVYEDRPFPNFVGAVKRI